MVVNIIGGPRMPSFLVLCFPHTFVQDVLPFPKGKCTYKRTSTKLYNTTAMYSSEDYTEMILIDGETHCTASVARRLYSQRFPMRRLPSAHVFRPTEMHVRTEIAFQRIVERPIRDSPVVSQNVTEYFGAHPTRGTHTLNENNMY